MSTDQKKPAQMTGYRVETESYPSGMGCYYGQDLDEDYIEACTTTHIVGEYDSLKEAEQAAIEERNSTCQFDDWAEDFYDDAGPPFLSSEGENYDEDENVHIYIINIAKEVAMIAKETAANENAIQEARSSNATRKRKAKTSGTRMFGPEKDNFKLDTELFLRNPCHVAGGQARVLKNFPGTGKASFVCLIQRLSDRNYTMRSLCLENSGARYTNFSLPQWVCQSVAWLPDTNLDDHASNETILDTFHTDLFDPKTGKHALTAKNLLAAAHSKIECLFLTNFTTDPKAIVKAIQACPNLKCITLNSSSVSKEILQALAKCHELRGLIFCETENKGADHGLDEGLALVLSGCPHLKFLFVDSFPFEGACWKVLAERACHALEVLWIDCPVNRDGRLDVARGDHTVIRRVLTSRTLHLCMINPDRKLKSRFIVAVGKGKTSDSLNGEKGF
jgi:hypothetical protein